MATTTFADYQVLSGAKTTLDAATNNSKVEFDFRMKDIGMVISNDFRRPVLAFHVRVHEETGLKVFVNARQIMSWSLGADPTVKGLWHPWGAEDVLVDPPHIVTVRFIVPTHGRIDIENVVLWYQVRKDG
jgi:hypothetical protein